MKQKTRKQKGGYTNQIELRLYNENNQRVFMDSLTKETLDQIIQAIFLHFDNDLLLQHPLFLFPSRERLSNESRPDYTIRYGTFRENGSFNQKPIPRELPSLFHNHELIVPIGSHDYLVRFT